MDIKPIETYYNGYRFRSRLEARWAVFFDAAGIKYQYEPEGFEHDGVTYLPDFYLPDLDVYAEVKGHRANIAEEIEKCMKMIYWGGPIKQIVFLGEVPGPLQNGWWHFPALCWWRDKVRKEWFFFFDHCIEERSIGHISSARYPTWKNDDVGAKGDVELNPSKLSAWEEDGWTLYDLHRLMRNLNENTFNAFLKARQARFEHGETPRAEEVFA